ncbi:hypothetical protein VE02_08471 [Pseudogymnoascus sp. 03VT05]|nr:hypothetical protein VE02_08471 [Pseudogymnoascus sp. 03VT05]
MAMIGSMDPIPSGLLKSLAAYSAIYVPIKPQALHQQYHDRVLQFLKSRLGDEYNFRDWIASAQQCSRPQRSDADSGLFVLANAKSIALTLRMVRVDSLAQSISLRWQFAQELVTQSVVEAF